MKRFASESYLFMELFIYFPPLLCTELHITTVLVHIVKQSQIVQCLLNCGVVKKEFALKWCCLQLKDTSYGVMSLALYNWYVKIIIFTRVTGLLECQRWLFHEV